MKYLSSYLCILAVCLLMSFSEKSEPIKDYPPENQLTTLPFTTISLNSMSEFKPVSQNWRIVGNVFVDRTREPTFVTEPGTGILVNKPEKGVHQHLFTAFDHGDIEIELDVMMPFHSNSGLYFQGRYEIQLFDSWTVQQPQHADMGGIYQRWDNSRAVKGYEGYSPAINAAKAPGLWQHFKIIFHAPKFNTAGQKVENAMFKEVWLNGVLIHENQEVTGPTRASAFNDEKPMGPFMIQGDHGAVAVRNIQYKLYDGKKLSLNNVKMQEFESRGEQIPDYKKLSMLREIHTDSISAKMVNGAGTQRMLVYTGKMSVPNSGDYLFEMKINGGGGLLLVKSDTVVNMNGDYYNDRPVSGLITLQKGEIPFILIYNKHQKNRRGFTLSVEGPGIARYNLDDTPPANSNRIKNNSNAILVDASKDITMQRGFLMHKGVKRTHCISVGSPKHINYSFDLAFGSLLQVWGGEFLDASGMWAGRGEHQLEAPAGVPVSIHGNPDFAFLQNEEAVWPDSIPSGTTYNQLGYELDEKGNPTFLLELNGSLVTNTFVASDSLRRLTRIITTRSNKIIWHKLGEGTIIEKLPDGTYAIDDKNYLLDFSGNKKYKPVIRKTSGKEELLVKIPTGKQQITYTLTW